MSDTEFVEVGHTGRNVRKLKVIDEQRKLKGDYKQAHQSQTVCLWVGLCILYHVPVGHPLGDDTKTTGVCE